MWRELKRWDNFVTFCFTWMNLSINIDSKPIEKLIDVVSSAVGKLYEPVGTKRRADAEAYKIKVETKAEIIASLEPRELEQDFIARTEQRIAYQEIKKQQNIEETVSIAAKQLRNEESVSNKAVNEYWSTRFFRIVEDVSDEDMQALWGQILAGEVKEPGTYSLRTLEILKNLSSAC